MRVYLVINFLPSSVILHPSHILRKRGIVFFIVKYFVFVPFFRKFALQKASYYFLIKKNAKLRHTTAAVADSAKS